LHSTITPALTSQQQIWTPPVCLAVWQLVVLAQLLVELPGPPPPLAFGKGLLTLCRPLALSFEEAGFCVNPGLDQTNDLQRNCVTTNQIKYAISWNGIGTYCLAHVRGWEVLGAASTLVPRRATSGYHFDAGCASRAVALCLGGVWSADAGRPINYMKNMRTVTITYWSHVFFCDLFVLFGVCRCLGYPSGGVCSLQGPVRGEVRCQS